MSAVPPIPTVTQCVDSCSVAPHPDIAPIVRLAVMAANTALPAARRRKETQGVRASEFSAQAMGKLSRLYLREGAD
jgi:hypothetical protein